MNALSGNADGNINVVDHADDDDDDEMRTIFSLFHNISICG